jgi:peptide deformylase
MAIRRITIYPDPVLLSQTQAVVKITRQVRRLARDMLETMYAAPGVGLAAPQVGVRQRVIVVDVGEGPITLVNPQIKAAEGKQIGLEGCLSLPDWVGEVQRSEWVAVSGLDLGGKPITVEGESLLARALQHEVDHLDGILFIARVQDPACIWSVDELKASVQREVVHI